MATPSTLGSQRERQRLEVERGVLAPQPLGPGPQLRFVEGVVEAHHRHPVADLWNSPEGAAPTALVGESGVTSDGCASSIVAQLSDQRSYSASGISGAVERVVALVVVRDERAQLLGARRHLRRDGHGQAATPAPTTASGSAAS